MGRRPIFPCRLSATALLALFPLGIDIVPLRDHRLVGFPPLGWLFGGVPSTTNRECCWSRPFASMDRRTFVSTISPLHHLGAEERTLASDVRTHVPVDPTRQVVCGRTAGGFDDDQADALLLAPTPDAYRTPMAIPGWDGSFDRRFVGGFCVRLPQRGMARVSIHHLHRRAIHRSRWISFGLVLQPVEFGKQPPRRVDGVGQVGDQPPPRSLFTPSGNRISPRLE